jgi:hypothetical protein
MGEPGLKPLDSALCVSTAQRRKIEELRKQASSSSTTYWKHGYQFPSSDGSVKETPPDQRSDKVHDLLHALNIDKSKDAA